VKSNLARTLSLCLLAALSFTATCSGFPDAPSSSTNTDKRESGTSPRTVYVGSHLSEEQLLSLSALLRVKAPAAQLLLDSEPINHEQQRFLAAYHANEVVPIGSFPRGITDLENRLKCKMAPALCWQEDRPVSIWNALVPEANRVVVCPSKPRSLLLQSACLAGVLRAPLYINNGSDKERTELAHQIAQWRTKQVFAVAAARAFCNKLPGVSVVHLPDERMVAATCLRHLARHRPVRTLIVANPADTGSDKGGMSVLAPWIALHRHAALLLTNERGDNVNGLVESALRRPELERADTLLIVGSLKAIPMERRPNPIPGGKDPFIEMEPLTPRGTDVWSFATGRLFEADAGQLALRLARQELLRLESIDHHAVVVSNVGGGLPMLEAFSRNTIQELRNRGYQTSGLIGDVNKEDLRNELPNQDIFLWEGHHSTLVRDFGVPSWPEALSPALVVLQSCLALNEEEASPFLRRGGIGLIGSSTRVFSASGGGFALAFFDALLYDGQSVGGSLRQAKNFLLAYSLLKEKRLGQAAKLGAANVRTAWAFTLWGDPTLRLPLPPAPRDRSALADVR